MTFFFVSGFVFFVFVLDLGSKQPTKLCIVTMEKQELFSIVLLQAKQKKKLVFLGSKTGFYQRLKVEDNTICLGYVFLGCEIWPYI